jgi:NhaP-type Na+/H+ or K+/H+ antiporter
MDTQKSIRIDPSGGIAGAVIAACLSPTNPVQLSPKSS